jgi:hypothetical protein
VATKIIKKKKKRIRLDKTYSQWRKNFLAETAGKSNLLKMLTCPRRSSARTQPADQISIDVVYSVAPNISSGAR